MTFEELLKQHQDLLKLHMNYLIKQLEYNRDNHDVDKLENPDIFNIYDKHFTVLKSLDFDSDEYHNYQRDNFGPAHQIHAQNDHHFYSPRNNHTNPTLLDLIEAIVDIYVSNIQYSDNDDIDITLDVIKKSGICNIDVETYIYNTLKELQGEHKNEN